VTEERVYGLYKRENKTETEYLCLRADKSYSHFILRHGEKEKLSEDKWDFSVRNKESRIGLTHFEKYGISSPILFSHAKGLIVIRMDVDDHYRDFTRIDAPCED